MIEIYRDREREEEREIEIDRIRNRNGQERGGQIMEIESGRQKEGDKGIYEKRKGERSRGRDIKRGLWRE